MSSTHNFVELENNEKVIQYLKTQKLITTPTLHATDSRKRQAIHIAAKKGNPKLVYQLIKFGASVDTYVVFVN